MSGPRILTVLCPLASAIRRQKPRSCLPCPLETVVTDAHSADPSAHPAESDRLAAPASRSAPIAAPVKVPMPVNLADHDDSLNDFRGAINARRQARDQTLKAITSNASADPQGLLGDISRGHHYLGFTRGECPIDGSAIGSDNPAVKTQPGVWYREWAPAAHYLSLIGDFNGWDRGAHAMHRDAYGIWSIFLSDAEYANRLTHGSRVKVHIASEANPLGAEDRIPAYIQRVVQEPDLSFSGQFWMPESFDWQYDSPKLAPPAQALSDHAQQGLRIYEAHIGMAQEQGKVSTFDEFTLFTLPRIAALGYNAVQLMAVQEHPYYGSFGYHVSNLFAVASRFGTPEQLKRLIDEAHRLGLRVIMDVVHSHMVKNTAEGLNNFDGTRHQYFHDGPRGEHEAWDSLCYDYSKHEVQRMLLSNLRFWLEEYHFDGFRFDGVTSMLYLDHGMGKAFVRYDDYFDDNVDKDAVTYLMLANDLIHQIKPDAISIAEDVSGMPGMARPTDEGGLGFDYRLAMAVPDVWIKTLKEKSDDDWDFENLWHTLTNRRYNEPHIGYAESHDQAMVGDKTLAMWLMDKDLYDGMAKGSQNLNVQRGVALHKMIRLLTFALSGEGWLNFMGNEFGHPEWIDFPRQGNGYSYHYARRQWSLADAPHLRYSDLQAFDVAMQQLDIDYGVLADPLIEQLALHQDTKQMMFRRGPLVFAFNFHPTESYSDLRLPVPDASDYDLILSTDEQRFGGFGNVSTPQRYVVQNTPMYGRNQTVQVYLPSRSALVMRPV